MDSFVKIRSSQGCWTCRLRRKKCDEQKPVCLVCAALEISCHYSDIKPSWMDGGPMEKAKADELKAMVKTKATERRERKWAAGPQPSSSLSSSSYPRRPDNFENDNLLARTMTNSMALDSSSSTHNSDRENSEGASPETSPSSVTSHQNNHQTQLPNGSGSTDDRRPSSPVPRTAMAPGSSQPFGESSSWTPTNHNGLGSSMGPTLATSSSSFAEHGPGDGQEQFEIEINSTMMYLDYVVPFLYPFYKPSIVEAGRGWLLVLLTRNKALFHSALSLATFFFTVILDSAHEGAHENCKIHNFNELQSQQQLAIQQLQQDMAELNQRGIGNCFIESVRCLESIIQLLDFQVAITNTEGWQVHLDAAICLFQEVLANHSVEAARPWWSVLRRLSGSRKHDATYYIDLLTGGGRGGQGGGYVIPGVYRCPWTSDQAGFRFYTAHLLWTDIIAGTATGDGPKLAAFHAELLEGDDPVLPLDEFLGCQNWVMIVIGEVAKLAAWKKEKKKLGLLSLVELVKRAQVIEARLRNGIETLEAAVPEVGEMLRRVRQQEEDVEMRGNDAAAQPSMGFGWRARRDQRGAQPPELMFDPTLSSTSVADAYYYPSHLHRQHHNEPFWATAAADAMSRPAASAASRRLSPALALHTRIWAQSALTYLAVTVSGFQPCLPDVRESVRTAHDLLSCLPSSLALRTLAWPFTVTGCLTARPPYRASLLELAGDMGAMGGFGAVRESLNIMQAVWALRDGAGAAEGARCAATADLGRATSGSDGGGGGMLEMDFESWDVEMCLGILGHPPLLV